MAQDYLYNAPNAAIPDANSDKLMSNGPIFAGKVATDGSALYEYLTKKGGLFDTISDLQTRVTELESKSTSTISG